MAKLTVAQKGERVSRQDAIAEARAILDKLAGGDITEIPPPPAPPKDGEAADAMWAWYLEWSALARHEIKDRRLLLSLGFLRSYKKRSPAGDDDETGDLDDLDDAAPDDGEDDAAGD